MKAPRHNIHGSRKWTRARRLFKHNDAARAVPAQLGQLSLLRQLDLSTNKLYGTIPTTVSNSLRRQKTLLTAKFGRPPQFTASSQLALTLSNNLLFGPIPPMSVKKLYLVRARYVASVVVTSRLLSLRLFCCLCFVVCVCVCVFVRARADSMRRPRRRSHTIF